MSARKVFQTSVVDGVMVVELIGVVSSLADDSITRELDAVREQLRSEGHKSVIVDLGQVAYFGSSMLEAIRALWNEVSPHSGNLILCNASEVGREILEVAKFNSLWPLVETRADALKKLK